jgi:hypothetical protein
MAKRKLLQGPVFPSGHAPRSFRLCHICITSAKPWTILTTKACFRGHESCHEKASANPFAWQIFRGQSDAFVRPSRSTKVVTIERCFVAAGCCRRPGACTLPCCFSQRPSIPPFPLCSSILLLHPPASFSNFLLPVLSSSLSLISCTAQSLPPKVSRPSLATRPCRSQGL